MNNNNKTITSWQAWLGGMLFAAVLQVAYLGTALAAEVVMYKSPNCGCCSDWGGTLKTAGFTVVEVKHDDMDVIKAKYGVPEHLSSCHTAIIDGYVIEGHVPAADVQRLLKEKQEGVVGLTAPGMPQQSPGMQDQVLEAKNYDVLAFDKYGETRVFTRY